MLGLALWAYYLLGGWRIGKRHRRLDPRQALSHMPSLEPAKVACAYLYYDASVDDARLALALARTAALRYGAAVANHLPVVAIGKDDKGRANGVTVDTETGRLEVRARSVVKRQRGLGGGGRALDVGSSPDAIRPAKGVHVVVPSALLDNDVAVVLPVPGGKGSVFAVPWGEHTYVGTTDTDYEGDLDAPYCTAADAEYLLSSLNASIREPVDAGAVQGSWAGLRPLLRTAQDEQTADLSRRHRVSRSASGVVTVAGGKLTTYRSMAEDTVDEVLRVLGTERACRTKELALQGAGDHDTVDDRGLGKPLRDHLVARYGGEARELIAWSTTTLPSVGHWWRAWRTCAPRLFSPSATRWPAASTTCSPAAHGPGSSLGTPLRLPPRPLPASRTVLKKAPSERAPVVSFAGSSGHARPKSRCSRVKSRSRRWLDAVVVPL